MPEHRSFRSGSARTDERRAPRMLGSLGAATAMCVIVLVAATAALGDISATSSGDGMTLTIATVGPVLSGVATGYTITVVNTSTAPIPSVSAMFQLPEGMTLKATPANCVKNLFGGNAGPASCSFGVLAPGAVGSATVSIVAATPGSFTIPASAIGQVPLPDGGFQVLATSADLTVPVAPGPTDVQVTGSSNNGSPPVGAPFSYTFQVKDNGPQGASGVTFDDVLPATLSLVGFSSDVGACTRGAAAGSVHCDIGDLAVGRQATIVITAIPAATGPVTNTATIGTANPDTQQANNSVGVTVQPR